MIRRILLNLTTADLRNTRHLMLPSNKPNNGQKKTTKERETSRHRALRQWMLMMPRICQHRKPGEVKKPLVQNQFPLCVFPRGKCQAHLPWCDPKHLCDVFAQNACIPQEERLSSLFFFSFFFQSDFERTIKTGEIVKWCGDSDGAWWRAEYARLREWSLLGMWQMLCPCQSWLAWQGNDFLNHLQVVQCVTWCHIFSLQSQWSTCVFSREDS